MRSRAEANWARSSRILAAVSAAGLLALSVALLHHTPGASSEPQGDAASAEPVASRGAAAPDATGVTVSYVPAAVTDPDVVNIHVEHTLFHPMDNVVLQVERMNGRMVGKPGKVISLDDPGSFSVEIDQAVTRLSARDLSALINSYLLKKARSAIRHLDLSFDGQQVVLKGEAHKLITLPFEARGVLSTTPEGELRMHMQEFRVAGVLDRGFLAFFGIRLDDVAQPRHKASFRVEGDDFITSINELFPPPLVTGRLTRIHVEKQDLVQVIGVEPPEHAIQAIPKALPEPPNYIYFTGGRMRFGRMTMENVDLKMVDETPEDPFDFSLQHYQQQIQAGYVKVLPSQAVVVYAGDWGVVNGHKRK